MFFKKHQIFFEQKYLPRFSGDGPWDVYDVFIMGSSVYVYFRPAQRQHLQLLCQAFPAATAPSQVPLPYHPFVDSGLPGGHVRCANGFKGGKKHVLDSFPIYII